MGEKGWRNSTSDAGGAGWANRKQLLQRKALGGGGVPPLPTPAHSALPLSQKRSSRMPLEAGLHGGGGRGMEGKRIPGGLDGREGERERGGERETERVERDSFLVNN